MKQMIGSLFVFWLLAIAFAIASIAAGCGSHNKTQDKGFYTSGSREADQRAEQRIAKDQQLRGESAKGDGSDKSNTKRPLFERLGGEQGIAQIVEDFVNRALVDPRVNWERKGVTVGGFTLKHGTSVQWQATPANVEQLKKHIK